MLSNLLTNASCVESKVDDVLLNMKNYIEHIAKTLQVMLSNLINIESYV